ncbi:DUF4193 family protein [Kocuria sp.]|uniref:DUF4193 family protein n=1 Tax=Kocuria sp. TaxID=1871328 RepID=UPI0028119AC8|nr:DUF4193 family protein [Kocuria sp.]
MVTDYDAPPHQPGGRAGQRAAGGRPGPGHPPGPADIDDAGDDTVEGVDLPGADLSAEELTIQVIPERDDEFVCDSCFLVRRRSQLARATDGHRYCTECES